MTDTAQAPAAFSSRWLFSKDQIKSAPSVKDNFTAEQVCGIDFVSTYAQTSTYDRNRKCENFHAHSSLKSGKILFILQVYWLLIAQKYFYTGFI
mmetsp:Transcript_4364/g.12814  ORF Transcript_4364/g.12814 Transcript_4364/m.12814 type:complete len:94 (+) Transcript_4364:269-550(+)